jgi:hypothetical protein
MTSTLHFGWARLPLLAAGFALAMALSAAAQTPPAWDGVTDANKDATGQTPDEAAPAADANDADL